MSNINLRVSSLAGWNDCPRRASTRTVYDIIKDAGYELRPDVKSVSAAIGSGIHAGCAHVMREKIQKRTAKLDEAVEIGIAKFREEADGGAEFDSKTDSNNTAEKQIENISGAFYYGLAPNIEPVDVERSYDAPVKAGFTLSGHPDIVEATRIRDLKTGRTGDHYQAQLGGYALLTRANGDAEPETVVIDWIPRVSIKKPQPEPVSYEYQTAVCKREAQAVIAQVQLQVLNFQRTPEPSMFPANPNSILCSPKYCTAYGTDYCPISKTFKE